MRPETHKSNFGAILVLFSAFLFGSYGVWSRLIGSAMGSFFQGWTRALIILLLLLPLAVLRKQIVRVEKSDFGWLAIFLLCTSLTQAPIYYAFNHLGIGAASLLFFVSMYLTMNIIGIVFMREGVTKIKLISAAFALAGMYLVFSFSASSFPVFAGLMAIVNGVASGGEVAFSKKLSGKYSPLYLIVLGWAVILPTNLLLSIMLGEHQLAPTLSGTWFWQLCYSLASLFAFWLVIAGFKYVDAGIGALIGLLEIVFSVLFGALIFGEVLTATVATGGMLIIAAAAFPHLADLYEKRRVVLTRVSL